MADIAEMIDSRQYVRDHNGAEAGSRTFRVLEAGNEIGAVDAFYALADSRIFPGAPGMRLDRVDVDNRAGNTLWIVKASYSTFGGFVRLDSGGGGNVTYSWGWDYKSVVVDLPFMSEAKKLIDDPSGTQPPALVNYWLTKIVKIEETRILRTLDLVHVVNNSNELDVIASQHNKYHIINGVTLLFRGAQVRRDATVAGQYKITYTWEEDRGTIVRASETGAVYLSGKARPPRAVNVAGQAGTGVVLGVDYNKEEDSSFSEGSILVRPPFYRLDVVVTNNASTGNTDLPRAVGILDHDIDELGWMRLPGVVR